MKTILFPFELGNPIYKEAYVYAINFARNVFAELILLNVFSIKAENDITKEKYECLKKENWIKAYNEISIFDKYYLENHANLKKDLNIKFSYRFIHGNFKEEIKKITEKEKIDLIVLPLSDKRPFNKRQIKIIRENTYEKNRSSLLIIPFLTVYQPIENIVFSTDFELNHCMQYVNEIRNYASAFDAKIHFLHISHSEKIEDFEETKTYQAIMNVVRNSKRHVIQCIYGKNIVESVNKYVENHNADILIVVKQQHYFLDTIFHSSISNKISFNSKIPVLVMREKAGMNW